jgi:hypothetical protein
VIDYIHFIEEFAKENAPIKKTDANFCKEIPFVYSLGNIAAFDINHGDSIYKNTEMFVIKAWKPYNAVKFFTYDFKAK